MEFGRSLCVLACSLFICTGRPSVWIDVFLILMSIVYYMNIFHIYMYIHNTYMFNSRLNSIESMFFCFFHFLSVYICLFLVVVVVAVFLFCMCHTLRLLRSYFAYIFKFNVLLYIIKCNGKKAHIIIFLLLRIRVLYLHECILNTLCEHSSGFKWPNSYWIGI